MRKCLALMILLVLSATAGAQDCFQFLDYLPVVFEDDDHDCHPVSADVVDGILYLDCVFDGLSVWDFTEPANPYQLGVWDEVDYVDDTAVVGHHVFMAARDDGLIVVDCADPTAPLTVANISNTYSLGNIEIQGDLAYATSSDYGLLIYDISEPRDPVGVGAYPYQYARKLHVDGQYVYITGYEDVRIFDVSDPGAPQLVSTLVPLENNHDVHVADGLLCVGGSTGLGGAGSGRFATVDVSDPASPVTLGVVETVDAVVSINRAGDLVYGGINDDGLRVIDVSDPTQPAVVGERRDITWIDEILLQDNLAIASRFWDGWSVIDISQPVGPAPVGAVELADNATGLCLAPGRTYVADWSAGLTVVDTADPTAPTVLGSVDTPGLATQVAVQGQHAFVADHSAGLTVVDVSQPTAPVVVAGLDVPGQAAHVLVSGAVAYVSSEIGGVHLVDIASPTAPQLLGTLDTAYLARSSYLQNDRLFVVDGYGGLVLGDVSDPTAPQILDVLDLGADCRRLEVRNDAVVVLTASGLAVVKHTEDDELLLDEFLDLEEPVRSLRLTDEYLYVGQADGDIVVFMHGDLMPMLEVGLMPARDVVNDLAIDGQLLYVADSHAGLTIMPLACAGLTAAPDHLPPLPTGVAIEAVAPNPFNPRTVCAFSLDRRQQVTVAVYDLRGRCVRELRRGTLGAGAHRVEWDGRDGSGRGMPSGVYLMQVRGESGRDGRTVSLVK